MASADGPGSAGLVKPMSRLTSGPSGPAFAYNHPHILSLVAMVPATTISDLLLFDQAFLARHSRFGCAKSSCAESLQLSMPPRDPP